jgi:hypothetical protein
MFWVGFESTIPALDRAATVIGIQAINRTQFAEKNVFNWTLITQNPYVSENIFKNA